MVFSPISRHGVLLPLWDGDLSSHKEHFWSVHDGRLRSRGPRSGKRAVYTGKFAELPEYGWAFTLHCFSSSRTWSEGAPRTSVHDLVASMVPCVWLVLGVTGQHRATAPHHNLRLEILGGNEIDGLHLPLHLLLQPNHGPQSPLPWSVGFLGNEDDWHGT